MEIVADASASAPPHLKIDASIDRIMALIRSEFMSQQVCRVPSQVHPLPASRILPPNLRTYLERARRLEALMWEAVHQVMDYHTNIATGGPRWAFVLEPVIKSTETFRKSTSSGSSRLEFVRPPRRNTTSTREAASMERAKVQFLPSELIIDSFTVFLGIHDSISRDELIENY
ncbi:hypothetical protein Ae201684P_021244 [Aphanomyces euteiches]|nr:hypothetical protein Ae201684P_021244 [Aphanomyces euteiches]